MSNLNKDFDQKIFGYWTIQEEFIGNKRRYSKCICRCGTVKDIYTKNLHNGKTTSCGCKRIEHDAKDAALKSILITYKSRAKRKNTQFELSFPEFKELILGCCYYCGANGGCHFKDFAKHHTKEWRNKKQIQYTGIDRLDSMIGYNVNNCVTCCIKCNKAKNTMSFKEFKEMIYRVYTNLELKNQEEEATDEQE